MKKVTIDFETRSAVEIKKAGAWRYAEDPSTEVICLAYRIHGRTWIWYPRKFSAMLPEGHDLPRNNDSSISMVLKDADIIEAHNMEFERAVWHHVMHRRHGFPDLPLSKCYCSAAKASMHSLPRDLKRAGAAMKLPVQKDDDGHRLMLKMCKPRAPRKADIAGIIERGGNPETAVLWHETPENLANLGKYCMQDVEAEECLSDNLRDLSPLERRVWLMDQEINQRGVYVDLDSVNAVVAAVEAHEATLSTELKNYTPHGSKQVGKLLDWMDIRGVELPDLQKHTVEEALAGELPAEIRRVLEIRRSLGKTSVAKYTAMKNMAGKDSRIRGLYMYHGANTGRWSGKGIQPQNLPRGVFTDVDVALKLIKDGAIDILNLLYGDTMDIASTLVRPMLSARPGRVLIAGDFSSIEARGTAWVAGEEPVLEAFRAKKDLYKVAACDIFGVEYDEVTKYQRQVGKTSELALGYQGGIGAYSAMAATYGVDLEDLPQYVMPNARANEKISAEATAVMYLKLNGDRMSFKAAVACDIIKQKWRSKRPRIVKLWWGLEDAAMQAVKNPGELWQYRGVMFKVQEGFLIMRLPSGRRIYYRNPGTKVKTIPNSKMRKEVITYWGINSVTQQWCLLDTYGGKLTENAVQGFCRDLLAEAMLRVDLVYPVVMHVHDELVAEMPKGMGSVEDLCAKMAIVPKWATGLPIAATGWCGKRYRKE